MNERIDLAELRDSLETCAPLAPQFAAEVLALIDAVEAAHHLQATQYASAAAWTSAHDTDDWLSAYLASDAYIEAKKRQTTALARFDLETPA